MRDTEVAMVLAGGISLGSYGAGAYAEMHEAFGLSLAWLAGSSIGAVNAAIIAGSEPDQRVARLRDFWKGVPFMLPAPERVAPQDGPWRHAANWFSALQTRTIGRPGLFRLQPLPDLALGNALGIYDLSPLRVTLERMVDFDRLNGGEVRVSIVTTDVATGEMVVFDTDAGDRIGTDHLLASCGFLPEFEPIEIDGRLLGDGGLVANAPVEVILGDLGDRRQSGRLICFVVDLFARDGGRPNSLVQAQERRLDLLLANQTEKALAGLQREDRLRRLLAKVADRLPPNARNDPALAAVSAEERRGTTTVLYLSYRAAPDEARSEKQYDFSRATLADRWGAGAEDMTQALEILHSRFGAEDSETFAVHRIRR